MFVLFAIGESLWSLKQTHCKKNWRHQRVLARSENVGEVRECWRGQRVLARSENVGEATTCRQRHTMLVNSECSRVHTVMTMSESLGWSQIVGEIV